MKFPRPYTLKEIADLTGAKMIGDADFPVLGLNEIHVVEPGDIVFVDHPKYYDKALASQATIVLIDKAVDCPDGKALLISEDPFRDFNRLINHFEPFKAATEAISPRASIGKTTIVQPNCFIADDVVIGEHCLIHANVIINNGARIGDDVVIHSGTVIGADGFYYKKRPEGFDQLRSGGSVRIENEVHIGANCTIDKGVTAATTIKEGTKIDNQVQIGHDTVIGKRCLIAAQCGIAGCVIIEDQVTIWGQVGISSGVTIGEKAILLAKSGVSKSIPGHVQYFGVPAENIRSKYREMAALRQLPDIIEAQRKLSK